LNKLEVLQLGIAFYLFSTGKSCNIPRRRGFDLKLACTCMWCFLIFYSLPCD
jgi:hypothetical protein